MKKLVITAVIAVALIVGVFLVLLSGTGPQHADPQAVTIILDDNFER